MFAGNAVHAASQWALLSLIAKLGSAHMVGQYALALAVGLPVAMLAHMNLRAVLATDVERRHPFGDYFCVRLAASAAGLAATAVVVRISGYRGRMAAIMLALACVLAIETVSDLYYGAMQRRERLDQVGKSMILRAAATVLALGAVLAVTRDLLWAALAILAARITMLLAYDRPRGSRGEDLRATGLPTARAILLAALPLGGVLALISLTANLPRYAIERYLGTRELGAYAAVASFITVGNTVMNALGQSATPRLAQMFSARRLGSFRRLAARLAGIAAALGACGVGVAAVFGPLVLRLLYRPEYVPYSGLLVAVMAAGTMLYIAISLGYAVTSARSFGPQMPLLAAVAATSGLASWLLVPRIGLWGAAIAVAAAGAVQTMGQLVLLARVLGRAERVP